MGAKDRENHNNHSRPSLGSISEKISKDKDYVKRLLEDYEFAKDELSKAGLELDRNTYNQMKDGYKTLNDAARKVIPSDRAAASEGGQELIGIRVDY